MKAMVTVLMSLIIMSACSKSDSVKTNTSEKLVQGSWNAESDTQTFYDSNNNIVNQSNNLVEEETWKFNNGNLNIVRINPNTNTKDSVQSTYSITDKSMIVTDIEGTHYAHVSVLNDSVFSFSVTDSSVNTFGTPPVVSDHNIISISLKKL